MPSGPGNTGVTAYELATGDNHKLHAASSIATGSGRMYKTTSNAHTLTGDGIGIVFRRTSLWRDMEFHQLSPYRPGRSGHLNSAVRGEGGRGCSTGEI